jgi:CxxC motif-containing protein (DUF1111 family)
LGLLGALAAACAGAATPTGGARFDDPLNPPYFRPLKGTEPGRVELGQAVFTSLWAPAGAAGAAGRVGLGPLFNAASCGACHTNAGRGRGPSGEGQAPSSLVIQLATRAPDGSVLPRGDPVYGRVFNTVALKGVMAEGTVMIRYEESPGRYPDGTPWSLRRPRYELTGLKYGSLMPDTLVKPRLAPALFGVGLLEAVPEAAIRRPADDRSRGRFGWQADAVSIRDQTGKAFALEMGLTSADYPRDDCTREEPQCPHPPDGSSPEVSAELFDAVVAFETVLAVPQQQAPADAAAPGASLFARVGCASCHVPRLPVPGGVISPYTDLRLHDLGAPLADATIAGLKVASRWRTAPLWALGYRPRSPSGPTMLHDARARYRPQTLSSPTFLHDGRARTVEEAILWHDGEGRRARDRFEHLSAGQRNVLLMWLDNL